MDGLMMHRPLLIPQILEFAVDVYGSGEIVSETVEGGTHRSNYAQTAVRVAKLANALSGIGVELGDRIATLAWNGYRHFELYYAISGIGALCHTINPRLSAEQMIYIINHAQDKIVFVDLTFVPLLEARQDSLPAGITYVIMTDQEHMPETTLNALCYETLLESGAETIAWPEFGENTASGLCYTSGTTGNPKGVLFSHRAMVLHALMGGVAFQHGLRAGRKILPVVPLFHANAWGLPYVAPLVGASMVFPGPNLDGPSIYDLIEREGVNSAWGVPTVWLGLLNEIEKRGAAPTSLDEVVIGGSAAPPSMIEAFENRGITVCHAWGMTEMSPVGTQGGLTPPYSALPMAEQVALKTKQGRRVFGVDLKIVDEEGAVLPHDGTAQGELFVRGNAIISAYYKNEEATAAAMDKDGWFGTGDVATIDQRGFLTITDRAKDLIKSGGEWISSIDVENMAMSHDAVANCAVIAIPDEKWTERPLLVVVAAPGKDANVAPILDHLSASLAKWQVPDDVVFVDELPLTATGKVSKMTLRQRHSEGAL
jgi:acyl-CoA synthetase (AMP-forming)/AMP-acid ligase II